MKFYPLSIFALFLSIYALPQKDEEWLQKMEHDWLTAEFKNDTAAIAKMMDETFTAIGSSKISSKQEELDGIYENMSQRLKNEHIVDSLHFEEVHIKIDGNAAIVTFISVTKGRIKNVPFTN